MEKLNVTVRVAKQAVASLDKLGAIVDRDRSYLINQAIESFIAHQKWQVEEVERAIAEVEAGKVMTHKEFVKDVMAWKL